MAETNNKVQQFIIDVKQFIEDEDEKYNILELFKLLGSLLNDDIPDSVTEDILNLLIAESKIVIVSDKKKQQLVNIKNEIKDSESKKLFNLAESNTKKEKFFNSFSSDNQLRYETEVAPKIVHLGQVLNDLNRNALNCLNEFNRSDNNFSKTYMEVITNLYKPLTDLVDILIFCPKSLISECKKELISNCEKDINPILIIDRFINIPVNFIYSIPENDVEGCSYSKERFQQDIDQEKKDKIIKCEKEHQKLIEEIEKIKTNLIETKLHKLSENIAMFYLENTKINFQNNDILDRIKYLNGKMNIHFKDYGNLDSFSRKEIAKLQELQGTQGSVVIDLETMQKESMEAEMHKLPTAMSVLSVPKQDKEKEETIRNLTDMIKTEYIMPLLELCLAKPDNTEQIFKKGKEKNIYDMTQFTKDFEQFITDRYKDIITKYEHLAIQKVKFPYETSYYYMTLNETVTIHFYYEHQLNLIYTDLCTKGTGSKRYDLSVIPKGGIGIGEQYNKIMNERISNYIPDLQDNFQEAFDKNKEALEKNKECSLMKADETYPEFPYPEGKLSVHIPAQHRILKEYLEGVKNIIEIDKVKDLLTFFKL